MSSTFQNVNDLSTQNNLLLRCFVWVWQISLSVSWVPCRTCILTMLNLLIVIYTSVHWNRTLRSPCYACTSDDARRMRVQPRLLAAPPSDRRAESVLPLSLSRESRARKYLIDCKALCRATDQHIRSIVHRSGLTLNFHQIWSFSRQIQLNLSELTRSPFYWKVTNPGIIFTFIMYFKTSERNLLFLNWVKY